jgi:hypothetical protein
MAEPWASTNNPPNNNMEMMMGNSQNFLRTRRNRHNSEIILMGKTSKLIFKTIRGGTRRGALDPIGLSFIVETEPEGVSAKQSHEDADRGEYQEKQNAQNYRTDNFMQQ